jgi:hypothetical protein
MDKFELSSFGFSLSLSLECLVLIDHEGGGFINDMLLLGKVISDTLYGKRRTFTAFLTVDLNSLRRIIINCGRNSAILLI